MDTNETTDLAKPEANTIPQVQISPDAPLMVQVVQMMQSGIKIDTDQMSKMQEMAERHEANEARKDFAADFTIVQANIAAVIKTARNNQTNSNYAKLEGVIEASKPVYTEHGFSVIYYEGETEKEEHIRVCADVLHKAGHKETYHYDVPLGGKGIKGVVNMTAIHAKATSITYGQRYLLCMIWNIPTQDKDGNPPPGAKGPPEPTPEEQKALDAMCDAMIDSVPEGMTLDRKRVAVVAHANAGGYPDGKKSAGECAKYVIEKINGNWASVCQKPS